MISWEDGEQALTSAGPTEKEKATQHEETYWVARGYRAKLSYRSPDEMPLVTTVHCLPEPGGKECTLEIFVRGIEVGKLRVRTKDAKLIANRLLDRQWEEFTP